MSTTTTDEALGLQLAQRSYVYGLFHMFFAGAPTSETLSSMFSEQAETAFRDLSDAMGDAAPLQDLLGDTGRSYADWAAEAPACISAARGNLANGELLEELNSDYTKLLKVPGHSFVHPWESPYIGKETMIFQDSTVDVRSFYHKAGLKLQEEKKFPDDHIAAMMDYLSNQAIAAYESFADGDDAQAIQVLEESRLFIQKHLFSWIDKFVSNLAANDSRGYYASMAAAMDAFVKFDYQNILNIATQIEAL